MPKWYFSSKDNQEKLHEELGSWMPTPFRHLAGVKNVGADCVHFMLTALDNIGATKNAIKFIPRYYGHDWCHHTTEQKLYDGLIRHPSFVEVTQEVFTKRPMNGDVILYQFGKAASHCGIYLDKCVWQAINFIGVQKVTYVDPLWYRRRKFAFRVRYV